MKKIFSKKRLIVTFAAIGLAGAAFAAYRIHSSQQVTETATELAVGEAAASSEVWICGGPKSRRYHSNKSCGGLSRCSRTPQKISLSEATKRQYSPCRKCY